jgi:hypothetical protein
MDDGVPGAAKNTGDVACSREAGKPAARCVGFQL